MTFEGKGLWTPASPSLSLGFPRGCLPPGRGALAEELGLGSKQILSQLPLTLRGSPERGARVLFQR